MKVIALTMALMLVGIIPAGAAIRYATGFENPPFGTGDINLQDNWAGPTGGTLRWSKTLSFIVASRRWG